MVGQVWVAWRKEIVDGEGQEEEEEEEL
jgi:hypothetical protein